LNIAGQKLDLNTPENKVRHKFKRKHKMKNAITLKTISIILAGTVLLSSCASTTMIQSTPSGAKVYLNQETVGKTPYSHTDTKIVGSTTTVRLEKEGYETFNTSFSRNEQADVGAIIGGLFAWVPFLWTMKYKPVHTYELSPLLDNPPNISSEKKQNTKSRAERLRELKQLLDEKIITQEEYEKGKKKILEE
jgi:PEGA domain-containing protein